MGQRDPRPRHRAGLIGITTHLDAMNLPPWLEAELRSDHAGETGAVLIYRGILAVSRDPSVHDFAVRHMATEQGHLRLIEQVLPAPRRSTLLPLWRVAGWLTGALPALFGRRAVFATIDAVESFVDHHYQQQIDRLDAAGSHPALRAMLAQCQEEEVHHRDEARGLGDGPPGPLLRLWLAMVDGGSKAAVAAARRI